MRTLKKLAGAACLAAVLALPAHATADIVGVEYSVTSNPSPIVRINESTGVGVVIGNSGFTELNSLAANSFGTLYAATDADTASKLVTINPNTGAGALVTTLNFGSVSPDIRGLAFSSSDVLFTINNTGPRFELNPDDLYTINTATGVGTSVGATGLTSLQGLDFSLGGVLYGWDIDIGLVTIDTATGLATDVNGAAGGTVAIQSIIFEPDGTLFGAGSALYTIDATTGITTLVGSGGYADVRGIEFVAAVPEPASLALLGLGLAGLGLSAWRRRASCHPSQGKQRS